MHLFFRSVIAHALLGVMLVCSPAAHAKYPAVELGQLVKQALEEQKGGFLDWSFLSRQKSPVTWLTDGIDFRDYTRKGTVVASVDGFIPEVLENTVTVRPWSVALSGSKFGITAVHLSNDGCFGTTSLSSGCASKIARIPQSLASSSVTMDKICEFGPGAARSEIYRISIRDLPSAYLHILIHEGSGGNTVDVSVILRAVASSDVPLLRHDSAICGVLFFEKSGLNGSLAWDYRERIK